MFIKTYTKKTIFERKSKLGLIHSYSRIKTIASFRCDNCDLEFERELKRIDKKRLSNNYFHCCSRCDAKRFAQRKGVERKKIWDMPAGIDWPINKY